MIPGLGLIRALFGWLGSGPLDRILSTVDRKVAAQTDREALKADIIREHYRTRADFMRAGGFWLMLIFAIPLALWWSAVLFYSMLWCRGCIWPQSWTIAALPQPLDQWAGLIMMAIFGVLGVTQMKR